MNNDPVTLASFDAPVNVLVQGASRGIGLEFARLLLANPAVGRVHASCRAPDRAPDLQTLIQAGGERIQALTMDVTVEASVAEIAQSLAANDRTLDLIINCAGVLHDGNLQPERRLADIDPVHMLRSYQVNAVGPLLVAKHFHPLLADRGKSVFASLSARVGSIGDNRLGGWYAYRAAKAAQNMITRNLSIELRRRRPGVICIALHPGTVDTDLSRPFQRNLPQGQLFTREHAVRQLLRVIDSVTSADSGGFFAFDGEPIVW